jgi:hypothetical protein
MCCNAFVDFVDKVAFVFQAFESARVIFATYW